MPHLFTVPAGVAFDQTAAAHVLASLAPVERARAVLLMPNRRSCHTMHAALARQLAGKTSLLPRILPLADADQTLLSLLGEGALALTATIPPAMSAAQHRYLLAQQIHAFERRRMEGGVTLHYALTLADTLMALQEQCTRAGVVITQEKLRALVHADVATHWKQALLFLGILTDSWPALEAELGLTTAAAREVALTHTLAAAWVQSPPDFPVFAIGSTGSQPATAHLLQVIADMPRGAVILPGLDTAMHATEWATIRAGHPLFHLKALLDYWPRLPSQVVPLATAPRSLWLDVLADASAIAAWSSCSKPTANIPKLIPCAHSEEEARVIALLLREGLEEASARSALITPDEGLMARVAVHLQRDGIRVDRASAGTLATTQTGSLWQSLLAAINAPDSLLTLRSLLHHPLLAIDGALLAGLERGWHGVNRNRAGQLPRHDAALRNHSDYGTLSSWVKSIFHFNRQRMGASAWVAICEQLLAVWMRETGQGADAVAESIEDLAYAEDFGPLDSVDFASLLSERLSEPWRDAGVYTHPRIAMLTPVEARGQTFDRVIIANMQEVMWPGVATPNPWLNRAAQQALGLPAAEEGISRMAHDMLMLASSGTVFLTYPQREGSSPTARSRFIERLVTFMASHGVAESAITSHEYPAWASELQASEAYVPEPEARPNPPVEQRPHRLPVSEIDKLFTDPFTLYARHVLDLKPLAEIDAAPEASDFGTLAHKAIEALTSHWTFTGRAASEGEIIQLAEHALRDFSARPNVDLFWRTRLVNSLHYINSLEADRRGEIVEVSTERAIEGDIAGVTLHGRIDRVEARGGGITVIDHKTGNLPSDKDIADGRALQLMIYGMLLKQGGAAPEAVEYWGMPRLGRMGQVRRVALAPEQLSNFQSQLGEALNQMVNENKPFLARPISNGFDERFGNDYDGISRYDEWAS